MYYAFEVHRIYVYIYCTQYGSKTLVVTNKYIAHIWEWRTPENWFAYSSHYSWATGTRAMYTNAWKATKQHACCVDTMNIIWYIMHMLICWMEHLKFHRICERTLSVHAMDQVPSELQVAILWKTIPLQLELGIFIKFNLIHERWSAFVAEIPCVH